MTKYVKVAVTTQYNIIRVVKPYRDIGCTRNSSADEIGERYMDIPITA